MSGRCLYWAWGQSQLSRSTRFVLVSLADQANDNGLCWPSVRSICERTGLCERTVFKALAFLASDKADSVVEVVPRWHGTGARRSSTYVLHMERGRDIESLGRRDRKRSEQHARTARPLPGDPPADVWPGGDTTPETRIPMPLHAMQGHDDAPAPDAGGPCTECRDVPAPNAGLDPLLDPKTRARERSSPPSDSPPNYQKERASMPACTHRAREPHETGPTLAGAIAASLYADRPSRGRTGAATPPPSSGSAGLPDSRRRWSSPEEKRIAIEKLRAARKAAGIRSSRSGPA